MTHSVFIKKTIIDRLKDIIQKKWDEVLEKSTYRNAASNNAFHIIDSIKKMLEIGYFVWGWGPKSERDKEPTEFKKTLEELQKGKSQVIFLHFEGNIVFVGFVEKKSDFIYDGKELIWKEERDQGKIIYKWRWKMLPLWIHPAFRDFVKVLEDKYNKKELDRDEFKIPHPPYQIAPLQPIKSYRNNYKNFLNNLKSSNEVLSTCEELEKMFIAQFTQDIIPYIIHIIIHIIIGRNLVFCGPPGCGKTRLAVKLASRICGENNFSLVTANTEWTHFDIIGGPMFKESSEGLLGMGFRLGFLSKAVLKHYDSCKNNRPYWLIIDEINRANLDMAFGEAFTALDIEHRDKVVIVSRDDLDKVLEKEFRDIINNNSNMFKNGLKIPKSFRILATLNPYDRAILHKLGYAFRRRFAFVRIPGIIERMSSEGFNGKKNILEDVGIKEGDNIEKYEGYINNIKIEVGKWLDDVEGTVDDPLENIIGVPKEIMERLFGSDVIERFRKSYNNLIEGNKLDKLIVYAIELFRFDDSQAPIIDIGYAELVDLAKFMVVYLALSNDFSDSNITKAYDHALSSYVIPQLEYLSNVVGGDIDIKKSIEERLKKKYKELFDYGLINSARELVYIAREIGIKLESESKKESG